MKTFKALTGETYTTNARRKLDRFIETIPEERLFFSNNEMRMHVKDSKSYIAFGDNYVRFNCGNGGSFKEFGTIAETIEEIKQYI